MISRRDAQSSEWPIHWLGWPSEAIFGTVLADPPWRLRNQSSRFAPTYPTLSDEALRALPVNEIAAPAAHLYLWSLDQGDRLEFALQLARVWGFEIKHTIVWAKIDSRSRARFGGGSYFRKAHELVLFGVRGLCAARVHDVPSWFRGRRGRHSAKPERLVELIEKVSPGPRVELFARRTRPGWTVWGNEV